MPMSHVDVPRLWSDVKRKLKERGRRTTIAAASRLVERRKGRYPEGLISLGVTHASLGEIDKSVAALEQAMIQGSPMTTARARFELGKVLFDSKRALPRAVDALRQTTDEKPANLAAWYYLGQSILFLARRDLNTAARQALQRCIDGGAPLGREDEIEPE